MLCYYDSSIISNITAKMLLEIKAIYYNIHNPFILTSGLASPLYIDCRKLISYPRIRRSLIEMAEIVIFQNIGFEKINSIAGGETAGIPFAAWIADKLMLPMQYVRKERKGFGRYIQIEGDLISESRVLLVEDLLTNGSSKINFINALRQANAIVNYCFVIFHYNFFNDSILFFKEINIELYSMVTLIDILRVCKELKYFNIKILDELEKFVDDPNKWSINHGGLEITLNKK